MTRAVDIQTNRFFWTPTCHGRWMSDRYEPGLVSVIVPTYNRADLVAESMDSVWAQTYRPIELIVVDDGSNDGTDRVVEEWGKRHVDDTRFALRYFFQENRGVSAARNYGLIESRGEYIQFLDSDDVLLPEKLEKQVAILSCSPSVGYAYCVTMQTDSKGKPCAYIGSPVVPARSQDLAPQHNWHCMAPIFRRSVCIAVGPFSEDLEASVDWEYAARVKALGIRGEFIEECLAVYRVHAGEQIIRGSRLTYARAREKAVLKVANLLQNMAIESRAARNKCARYLIVNAVRYGEAREYAGYARCIGQAFALGSPMYKALTVTLRLLPKAVATYMVSEALKGVRTWRRLFLYRSRPRR